MGFMKVAMMSLKEKNNIWFSYFQMARKY